MTGSAIVREGYSVDDKGNIHHHDTRLSWPEADQRAGFRLDRRKAWAFMFRDEIGSECVCEMISFTQACSGCLPDDRYEGRGGGCSECGYTGKVRQCMWVPFQIDD